MRKRNEIVKFDMSFAFTGEGGLFPLPGIRLTPVFAVGKLCQLPGPL